MANNKTPAATAPATEPIANTTTKEAKGFVGGSAPVKVQDKEPRLPLGGLWFHQSNNGIDYLSGYMGPLRITVFRNSYKTDEKHPDYVMWLSPRKRPDVATITETTAAKEADEVSA
jgi:hypothetical protein